ncbi:DUF6415 family natural product biosynthesis protein [Streptomyces netropsis]|uniref:Putative membrane protein YccC n=1 Tax=Streptomyces netropsis TaxID=55404 RepID=A0A7W7LE53_STRNE|nr:DUF6415 family natural product biosynthesis protein [Streptomyces netropsis]MBB4888013.1 putative membrane protein YccC [Streptomyces netropsis]GGR32690.1 hypothetical protein GCM10010219_41930 [Streptomyces netropsis]
MSHHAVDTAAIQRTLDRALAIRSSPLELDELAKLETLLLGHIADLLPVARARIGRLWVGSLEWDRERAVLDRIAAQAQRGLGHGALADISHVTQLARDCRRLLGRQHSAERHRPDTPGARPSQVSEL